MPKKNLDFKDLGQLLSDGLVKAAQRPDINGYIPHEKQQHFHSSTSQGKLYIGGNRSGKSVGGVVEDIWWLTGRHPFRETPPPPVRGRLVCVDFPNGWEKIIKPIVTQWIPPSELIDGSWEASWQQREKRLTLANGSFLEIMSYEQDTDNFAGASRHFIHFDEEPPKTIWQECRMRLIDTGGSWWITMTPVEGMTWVYDDLYEKKACEIIEVDVTENPYLSPVEIESAMIGLDDQERAARKSGKFVQIGGLVFKKFNSDIHIIPPVKRIPHDAIIVKSIDHGYNNPTSVHWHIVMPNDTVITFAEHYYREWTIAQHAARIKQIEAELDYHQDIRGYCDPAMKQRNPLNGNSVILEYRLMGVPLIPSNNNVQIGLARMLGYLNHGKWFITENCVNLKREMRRYRWKTRESKKLQEKHGNYDEPHKKDDHAVDDCRYFFMSRPELAPELHVKDNLAQRTLVRQYLNGHDGVDISRGHIDRGLLQPSAMPHEMMISTDEHMGGEW
jgi:phage terminase large subunit-like protein